jgi:hypothetical protein
MNFHALRQQPFASALAAAGEGRPACFSAHARAKTMLILSSALRALECSFHDRCLLKSRYLTGDAGSVNSAVVIVLVLLLVLGGFRLRARA